jgi:hypothetical protein
MKVQQVLIFLTILIIISCKNTNSDETPKEKLTLQDSTLIRDSNFVEIFVWVDKLRLRKTPDRKSEILQELDEGETLLFLNEKSHFKEKVKLRGVIYDEPWLKVKTKNNKIGWIYGGAIKFEKPVFDYSPSPYQNCVSAFIKSKNREKYDKCTKKIKEQQLKKSARFITKTKTGYEIKLLSGETRTLQNSPKENEDFRQYEYLCYIERLGYFVFRVNFYEAGQYLLIDDKFGYSRPINGFPEPSPDYKHLVTTNADAVAGFEFNGVQLFGFTDHGMEIFFEKEFEFYEPFLPKWIDEKTVQIQLIPVDFAKNKKSKILTIQQNENGTWSEK